MNLYETFARQARANPEKAAVVDPDGEDITYGELEEQAAKVAAFLDEKTEPGDRVAVHMLDNPTFVAVALGAWRAGRVFMPVNYRFAVDEVAYVLDDVDPSVVAHDAVFAGTAETAVEESGIDAEVVQGHGWRVSGRCFR